jgi:hypothetical protein
VSATRRFLYPVGVAVLILLFSSTAWMNPFTMTELAELPREARGLRLHVRAVKDTFLLGEPVMIEVFLYNAGSDTVRDPCMFHSYDSWLTFYALRSDSEAIRIRQSISHTALPPPPLVIPPRRCVGTVLIFGSSDLFFPSTGRGPSEYFSQPFREVGSHEFVATYHRDPDKENEGLHHKARHIVSNPDSFFVAEPSGWNRTVYEAIGDTLFNPFTAPWSEDWEKDPGFWEDLCDWDSTSVYAPWLRAGRARCAFETGWAARSRSGQADFKQTVEILNELVERYPLHRFSQEAEFSIAAMICLSGRGSEAKEQFDRLRRRYPENVRAYETCRPNPNERAVEWPGLRDDPTVGAGTCPEEAE